MNFLQSTESASSLPRPEFMATLGLLPPYLAEDVENAYRAKLKEIRPDLGGDRQAFYELQNAYMRAKEYVNFRGDRRGWIANQVDAYLALHEIIDQLRKFGAEVELEALDWLTRSFGDFAQLTESVVGVRLRNATCGDEFLAYLVSQCQRLLELRRLDLAGSKISDAALRQLTVFRRLAELNLNNTPISWKGLQVVQQLPELESVSVEGVRLGWLARRRLAAQLRQNRNAAAAARILHPINVR